MIRKIVAMMCGLCAATVAGAVNDLDSTGRTVKYLDAVNPAIISYYSPTSQCFQFAPAAGVQTTPITCVPLAGTGYEPLPISSVGDIVVAANASYSLLSLNMQPVANYIVNNTSATRSTLILSGLVKVSIESSMLSDPSLINPRTGQPFNGKIETTYQWFFDQRSVEGNTGFAVANKIPFEVTILSRKALTSAYGISTTRAALVFARPITVKISTTGNFLGTGNANFFMNGRLFGD